MTKLPRLFRVTVSAFSAALGLSACHINGDVLQGRRDTEHRDRGDLGYSSASPCSNLRVVATSNLPQATASCSLPEGSLGFLAIGADGAMHIWVKRMADGRYAQMSMIDYADVEKWGEVGSHSISLQCSAILAVDPADAVLKEYRCALPTGLPLSLTPSQAGGDVEFYFRRFTLENPGCGANTTYELTRDYKMCGAPDGFTSGQGTHVEAVVFPELYWKS